MNRAIFLLLLVLLFPAAAQAKRAMAADVAPIVFEGLRYESPNDKMREGYIRITDVKTGKVVAEVEIYKTIINRRLEEDVQWVFITTLKIEEGKLIITDEHGRVFAMDLQTRKVTKVKGDPKEKAGG